MNTFKTIAFIVLFSMVLGAVLGLVYDVSREQLEINDHYDLQKALLYTINKDLEGLSRKEIHQLYVQHLKPERTNNIHYYAYYEEDQLVGYCFPFVGQGLWGTVHGYITVDVAGAEILGIAFTENEETPGLGARIDDLWFKEQFRGLDITGQGTYVSFDISSESSLATISGATLTVNAIEATLNEAITDLKRVLKEDFHVTDD